MPGEVYALLGANGAGKSTIARLACGLLDPAIGRVVVAGLDPGRDRGLGGCVGLAPQEVALPASLTVREILVALVALAGANRRERDDRVSWALRVSGSTERADERVGALSGGWKRRASLAVALIGRPRLLVLDEPTEGVDSATRVLIARGIREVVDAGAACLVISHDVAFTQMIADRAGVLHEGRLVLEGGPYNLLIKTFGLSRILTVRLVAPADPQLEQSLSFSGLTSLDGGVSWRLLAEDVIGAAERLTPYVEAAGGELSIRRPDLDDLVRRVSAA